MADITSSDFKKLIESQKETTRQLMSVEERAADDAQKAVINENRVEGGRKAWETRQLQTTSKSEKIEGKQSTFLGGILNYFKETTAAGAAEAEDNAKKKAGDKKDSSFLKNIATGITGIAKGAAEKVKGGFKSISKFLFGAMLVGVLAFLNSPKFEEIKNTLIDVVVPALAFLYDEIIKPLALYIGGKLSDLFTDIKAYVDGEKGLGAVLTENIGIIAGIVAALAPGLTFGLLKTAVLGIGKALLWASGKAGITALIMKGLAAVKVAFVAVGNFLTGFLVPIKAIGLNIAKFTGIAALVVGVVFGIYKGIESAIDEFKATGNIWETVKAFLSNFLAEGVGIILNPIKDALSWIIGKVGEIFGIESITSSVTDILDNFDFVDGIKAMGNAISGLFSFIVDKVQSIIRAIPFGDGIADALFGTKPEQEAAKKAKEEEQKVLEKQRRVYKEKQELEKAAEEKEMRLAAIAQRKRMEATKEALLQKRHEQQAVRKAPIFERLGSPREAQAPTQNTVINAPNNVNAPTTTTLTTASTPMINTDRVFDKLSVVG